MFLNYDINNGLSVNSYRFPGAVACADILDFCDSVQNEQNAVLSSVDDMQNCLDQLQDNFAVKNSNLKTETLERIFDFIVDL